MRALEAVQEEAEAEEKKRKKAELSEARRNEKQIEAQTARARAVESQRARECIPVEPVAPRAAMHERDTPLQVSMSGADTTRAEGASMAGRKGHTLFDDSGGGRRDDASANGSKKRSKVLLCAIFSREHIGVPTGL